MHKEIHEQPPAPADALRGRCLLEEGDVLLGDVQLDAMTVQSLSRIVILR